MSAYFKGGLNASSIYKKEVRCGSFLLKILIMKNVLKKIRTIPIIMNNNQSKSDVGNTFVGGPLSSKNKEYAKYAAKKDNLRVQLIGDGACLFDGFTNLKFIPGPALSPLIIEAIIIHHKTGFTPVTLHDMVIDLTTRINDNTIEKNRINTLEFVLDALLKRDDIVMPDSTRESLQQILNYKTS